MRPPAPGQPEQTVLRHLWLAPAEAVALAARLAEHGAGPDPANSRGGDLYGLLISLYPADIPRLPADEPAEPG
jgi:hypothetical protein